MDDDYTLNDPLRRDLVKGSVAGLAAGVLAGLSSAASAQEAWQAASMSISSAAFGAVHELQPLPFDAAKLRGLSTRLIESHWANNYGGSVRALNEIKKRVSSALADADLPAFIYNDLKREHLMRTGSVVLHELYFENLGGDGKPPAAVRTGIGQAFGEFDRWETEFRRIAGGLGGGSGWVASAITGTSRPWKIIGWRIIQLRQQRPPHCLFWICTSIPTIWITARRPHAMSMRFLTTSIGTR
jgi:Fe-Mn family superoxide dismutase